MEAGADLDFDLSDCSDEIIEIITKEQEAREAQANPDLAQAVHYMERLLEK